MASFTTPRALYDVELGSATRATKNQRTIAELESALDKYRNILREHKLTLQPHVILINSANRQYLIYLDQGRYFSVNGLLEAIDGVIKLSMVLNSAYTPDAKPTWTFFQKYCYNINTSSDHNYTCLNTLLAYVKEQ
uniref:(northern house mosquito) hypothetical protein n=2 Tax=Culex pipiens TaxID=7175 RepID=A0A8D8A3Q3_CULPI